MTRDERTYKLKLLALEPTPEMIEAGEEPDLWFEGNWERASCEKHWDLMHAAAPNDATEKLVAILREAHARLEAHHYVTRTQIAELLKELE